VKEIENMNCDELLEFLKRQNTQQLKNYMKKYNLKYSGKKIDNIDKLYKIICNIRGYEMLRHGI